MKLSSIYSSIFNHTFFNKVNEHTFKLYRIKNENVRYIQAECMFYTKYKKKYRKIISSFEINKQQEKSNTVWICWLQGMKNAPSLVKRCYESVKRYLPDKNIIVITEKNLGDYVQFPSYIVDKQKKGIIPSAQYSDLIRICLLTKYGGTWIDSTVLLTGSKLPEYTTSLPLFLFKQLNLTNKGNMPTICSNWYISSYSNDPILTLTKQMLFQYWKTHDVLENYFIFHIFLTMAAEKFEEEWNNIPVFNNNTPHELMFELGNKYSEKRWKQIISATDIHKLTRHLEYSDTSNNFYTYIINDFL